MRQRSQTTGASQESHEDEHQAHSRATRDAAAGTSTSEKGAGEDVHNHDHSSSHGFGPDSSKLFAQAGYLITDNLDFLASAAISRADGIDDPSAALGYSHRLSPKLLTRLGGGVSFPISAESQELKKLATITPSLSAAFQERRWTFTATASVGVSMYGAQNSTSHSAAEMETEAGHKAVMSAGHESSASSQGEANSESTHDREKVRYSTGSHVSYRLNARLSAGGGIDLSRTYWQMDQPTWLTSATLVRLGCQFDQVNGSVGLGLQREDHDIAIPNSPLVRLLVQYSY